MWKIYSKYTDKKNGKKVTYQPTANYNGVLVISVDNDHTIFYYRFDDEKEKLYLLDVSDDEEVETVYIGGKQKAFLYLYGNDFIV